MTSQAILMTETAALMRVWRNPGARLRITNHAREEMAKDGILESDVRYVITHNGVCWIEKKRDLLWHVEGRDIDGKSIRLVLTVVEAEIVVKLVTAMAL
jgi:hypothetical protein